MADQEKVRLMTRLAMLEKHSGKRIRKAENTSRIDLITNPVWIRGIAVTLLFFAAAVLLAALNMDMVLDAVAKDQTKNLIMIVLIAWLSLLAVTILISVMLSWSNTRRISDLRDQYHRMLEQLERMNRMRKTLTTGIWRFWSSRMTSIATMSKLCRKEEEGADDLMGECLHYKGQYLSHPAGPAECDADPDRYS